MCSVALLACSLGDERGPRCAQPQSQYEGKVAGKRVRAPYGVSAQFLDHRASGYDPVYLGLTLASWGLELDHPGDLERWQYIDAAHQLALMFEERFPLQDCLPEGEQAPTGSIHLGTGPLRRNFGVYLFELAEHDVQPGTDLEILDASSLSPALHPDKDSRRDALRALIDQVQGRGPYAVVAFSPDRSDECATLLPSLLLTGSVVFARGGTVSFHDLLSADSPLDELTYPVDDVDWGAFSIAADFGDEGSAAVESECIAFQSTDVLR